MVNSGITITNENVNSGNPILIMTRGITTIGMINILQEDQEDSNIVSGTTQWDITELNDMAVKNPKFTINGLLDIDDNSDLVSINGIWTKKMTESILRQLQTELSEPSYIHIRLGATPYFISKHDGTACTEIVNKDATGGIKCKIKGIRMNIASDNISMNTGGQGARLDYSITLVETK